MLAFARFSPFTALAFLILVLPTADAQSKTDLGASLGLTKGNNALPIWSQADEVSRSRLGATAREQKKGVLLIGHPKVLATPHLGASTEEAQVNVALDVVEQILAMFDGRPPRSAVNMPAISAEVLATLARHLAEATETKEPDDDSEQATRAER